MEEKRQLIFLEDSKGIIKTKNKIGNLFIISDEDINENDYIITKDNRLIQVTYLLSKGLEKASKIILTTDPDLIKNGVQAIDDEFLEWFVKNPTCDKVKTDSFKTIYHTWLYKIIIPKEKPKYPIGGYAPGNYSCFCTTCENHFKGDKRAVQCEPCAIEMVNTKFETSSKGGVEINKQETLEEAAVRLNKLKFIEILLDADADHIIAVGNACFKEGVKAGAGWQQERSYSEEEVLKILTGFVDDRQWTSETTRRDAEEYFEMIKKK